VAPDDQIFMVTVHFISIKPVLSDHLPYETIFDCSLGHKTGWIVSDHYEPLKNDQITRNDLYRNPYIISDHYITLKLLLSRGGLNISDFWSYLTELKNCLFSDDFVFVQ
jgi:hypothetical protein